MGSESIDEFIVTECSDSEASKTPEANVDAIENKAPDNKEDLEEDSDEKPPYFPFESRGKQKSQIAGNGNSTKGQAIRPVKQLKVDEAEADKAKTDKKKKNKGINKMTPIHSPEVSAPYVLCSYCVEIVVVSYELFWYHMMVW